MKTHTHQRKQAANALSCSTVALPVPFCHEKATTAYSSRRHPLRPPPAHPLHYLSIHALYRIHNHTHLVIRGRLAHRAVSQNHLRRSLITGSGALPASTHYRRFSSRSIYFFLVHLPLSPVRVDIFFVITTVVWNLYHFHRRTLDLCNWPFQVAWD